MGALETAIRVCKGVCTYIPGLYKPKPGTGGTGSARYCYTVWLRHLIMAARHHLHVPPTTLAELGPGDSIGIGLAALLTGVTRYIALDVVSHASTPRNLQIFDELTNLFMTRSDLPGDDEFPKTRPRLESYTFPRAILSEEHLAKALAKNRVRQIGNAVAALAESPPVADAMIRYVVPWHEEQVVVENSVDMILSQAVLEHVVSLDHTYRALLSWLKPSGFMSHCIDFSCHEANIPWNSHWAHSDLVWRLMRGRRPYTLNREPHSKHVRLMHSLGFEVDCDLCTEDRSGLPREAVNRRFARLSDRDWATRNCYVVAVKPATRSGVPAPSTQPERRGEP